MSSIYYRRWTRMHFFPALKHFHKWGVLDNEYEPFKPILATNEFEEGLVKWKPHWKGKTPSLDKKLLDKLFLKYPDLRYEKLHMDRLDAADKGQNMFSYAYKFLRKQKIHMSQGFSESKAFQMVEKEFHSRIARKLDQTLLARGLAIGNRARSLLTTYQQQMEYESRLKMKRTQREVKKYEQKIQAIKDKVEQTTPDIAEQYKRVLYAVQKNQLGQTMEELLGVPPTVEDQSLSRLEFVVDFQKRVNNMFKTYYQRAASKDKLDGLTDGEIKDQIMSGPTKIRKQMNELLRITRKYNVFLTKDGQLNLDDVKSPKIKQILTNNPNIKIALMLKDLDYQQPHRMDLRRELKERKNALESKGSDLTELQKDTILKNKKAAYSFIQPYQLRENFQTYKAYETYEERLLRIQIKWLQSKLNDAYNNSSGLDTESVQKGSLKLGSLVDRFRRLKFRIDQKVKFITNEEMEEQFEEHKLLDQGLEVGKFTEYQAMFDYLRTKHDERRMTPTDSTNDDKIHEMISPIYIKEDPLQQGFKTKLEQ